MRPDLHSRKLTCAQEADLVRSYQNGRTVVELEIAFGISHATAYRILRDNGVEFNRRGGRRARVTVNGKTSAERVSEFMRKETEWLRERARIAKQRTVLPRSHGVCRACGKLIRRGESYGNDGNGVRHLRDCLAKTLEQARRYGTDSEYRNRVVAA